MRDKTFNIAKNPKYDGYQRELGTMVYKFFDKKASVSDIKNENMLDQCPWDVATRQSSSSETLTKQKFGVQI